MDKLKPVITHIFWVLFGFALLMPTIGWWITSGRLREQITTRTETVDKAFDDAGKGGSAPNKTWTASLSQINGQHQTRLDEAKATLWSQQKTLMTWPPGMQEEMATLPYRGRLKSTAPQYHYQDQYRREFITTLRIVDPFANGKGKIRVNGAAIQHVPFDKWEVLPPTYTEMWDAQEDIWLVRDLLQSIAAVNTSEFITDSPIRELLEIRLQGGDRSAVGGGGSTSMASGESDLPANYGMMGMSSPNFGGGGGGSSGNLGRMGIDFSLAQEFGSPGGSAAGGAGPMASNYAEMAEGAAATTAVVRRYVDDDPAQFPYRTRAFKVSLVMRQDSLPDLLAELNNSQWPVQIARVHQQDKYLDESSPAVGGGSSRGMSYPAGGGGEMDMEGFSSEDMGSMMMGGGAGGGAGAFGSGGAVKMSAEDQAQLDAALSDRYLVNVVIAGLMTLYNPPAAERELAERQNNLDFSTPPPTAAPAAADGAAATPAPDATAAPDAATGQ